MDEFEVRVIRQEEMLKSLEEKITMKIETMMDTITKNNEDLNRKIDKLDKKIDGVKNTVEELKEDIPSIVDNRIKENSGTKAYNVLKWITTSILGAAGVSFIVGLLTKHFGA